jgi:hypothetical protein
VQFDPGLLRTSEFSTGRTVFRFLDVDGQWQELTVPERGLAFTWCQVPIVYRLAEAGDPGVTISRDNGECQELQALALPPEIARELFRRTGTVRTVELVLPLHRLHVG